VERPVRESDPPNPLTRYGVTKAASEKAVKEYTGVFPWTIVRPPAMYGPRDTEILVYFKAFAGGLNTMIGFDEKYVSLLHSSDLVRGILLAAASERAVGETYHISSSEFYTWPQVGRVTGKALGKKSFHIHVPHSAVFTVAAIAQGLAAIQRKAATLNIEKARDITQRYWIFDVNKAAEHLGFRQEIPLEEGITTTIEWYRKAGWLK
jgi:nucleoside-diphosphate-sugar epimerase